MANKKSNIITYATIVIILLVVLVIVFKDKIMELTSGPSAQQEETVDITPVEANAIDKLITEAEELGKEKRYAEGITKLEKAKNLTDPNPSPDQSKKINSLLELFEKELLALKKESIIDKRITQAKEMGNNRKYTNAVSHLKETKEYKDPEPSQNQNTTIDSLIKLYDSKIARKPKPPRKKPATYKNAKELAEALYKRGRIALDKNRISRAIRLFSLALKNDPEHTLSYSYRGTAHYRKKETEKAMADSDEALKRDAQEPNAHLTKGEIYYDQMNDELAMKEYQAVIAKDKENAKAFYKMGVIELTNEKNNEAVYMFDTALGIENGLNKKYTRNSHYNKGIAKERLGSLDEAENDYGKAIETDRKYAKAHIQIAEILYKKSEFDKSLEKIKDLSLKLNKIERYTIEFLTGKNIEKHGEANNDSNASVNSVKAYTKAAKTNPKGYEALYNIGRILFNNQKYDNALSIFRKANEIKDDDYDVNYAIGLSLNKLGKQKESIAYFEKAVEINKDRKEANIGLAASYFMQNENPDRVIESLETALKEEPDNFIANKIIGIAYFETGKQEQAVEYLRKASSLKEDDMMAKRNLATALFYNKNFEEASVLYKEVLGEEQNNSENLLRLGECYIKTGDKVQAKETITALVNKFPDYKERREVKLYLRALEG